MSVFVEKHIDGYCLVYAEGRNEGFTVTEGTPPISSTKYFKNKKLAEKYATDNELEIVR